MIKRKINKRVTKKEQMKTNLKLPCSIFELAHIKLEQEGIFEWFDYEYYWRKWFEYIEVIAKRIDRFMTYQKYNKNRCGKSK